MVPLKKLQHVWHAWHLTGRELWVTSQAGAWVYDHVPVAEQFLSGYLISEALALRLVEVALIGPGVESGIGTEGTNTASFNSIKQTTSRLQHTASTASNTLSCRFKQTNKAF